MSSILCHNSQALRVRAGKDVQKSGTYAYLIYLNARIQKKRIIHAENREKLLFEVCRHLLFQAKRIL